MKCRHCHTQLNHIFLDLGNAPPSNAYLSKDALKTLNKIPSMLLPATGLEIGLEETKKLKKRY